MGERFLKALVAVLAIATGLAAALLPTRLAALGGAVPMLGWAGGAQLALVPPRGGAGGEEQHDLAGRRGAAVDEARMRRLLALFRLTFADPASMRGDLAGRPVYLGLAMTHDRLLRMKPQNLLVNLPLAHS